MARMLLEICRIKVRIAYFIRLIHSHVIVGVSLDLAGGIGPLGLMATELDTMRIEVLVPCVDDLPRRDRIFRREVEGLAMGLGCAEQVADDGRHPVDWHNVPRLIARHVQSYRGVTNAVGIWLGVPHQNRHQLQVHVQAVVRAGIASLCVAGDNRWPVHRERLEKMSLPNERFRLKFTTFVVVAKLLADIEFVLFHSILAQARHVRCRYVMQMVDGQLLTQLDHIARPQHIAFPGLSFWVCPLECQHRRTMQHAVTIFRNPSLSGRIQS